MRRLSLLLVCVSVVAQTQIVKAELFGPATFEDCILENMKGVTSDFAARAIQSACREKFPAKLPKCTSIKDSAERFKAERRRECIKPE